MKKSVIVTAANSVSLPQFESLEGYQLMTVAPVVAAAEGAPLAAIHMPASTTPVAKTAHPTAVSVAKPAAVFSTKLVAQWVADGPASPVFQGRDLRGRNVACYTRVYRNIVTGEQKTIVSWSYNNGKTWQRRAISQAQIGELVGVNTVQAKIWNPISGIKKLWDNWSKIFKKFKDVFKQVEGIISEVKALIEHGGELMKKLLAVAQSIKDISGAAGVATWLRTAVAVAPTALSAAEKLTACIQATMGSGPGGVAVITQLFSALPTGL